MPRIRAVAELRCTWRLEFEARRRGYNFVAGCDEAGRGSLIGPLYAAAVILDPDRLIDGLDDSKKLSPEVRSSLDLEIRSKAMAYRVVAVCARQIEALNVYQASRQAMLRALRALRPPPDFVLTDAMPLHVPGGSRFRVPHFALTHGDARSASIAAASILAKVARDAAMVKLSRRYPQYDLANNKGYGTPSHLEGLRVYGPCPEHRKTFSPVRLHDLPLFADFVDNLDPGH
jgi:ribonuclease HII